MTDVFPPPLPSVRSVHGHADADLQGLYDQLQREQEDLCSRRGLVPGGDQQTFQILLPNTFRLHYDDLLAPMQRVSGTRHVRSRRPAQARQASAGVKEADMSSRVG